MIRFVVEWYSGEGPRSRLRRSRATVVAVFGLIAFALAAGCASAEAESVKSVHVSGSEATVSCLSAKLCVLGGHTNSGSGALVKLRDGVPIDYYKVKNTTIVYGVSCPSAAGCVAVERPTGLGPFGLSSPGVSTKLTIINGSGTPTKTIPLTLPAGVTLGRIACTSMHSCELAGESVFSKPEQLAFGSWNGHRLSVRYMRALSGLDLNPGDISCANSTCVLVGSAMKNGITDGFAVTIHDGKPTGDHLIKRDPLFGVSCTSSTFCYASGEDSSGDGAIVPLTRGVAGKPISASGPISGIACRGRDCIAAGALPVPGEGITYGAILTLSSGAVTGSQAIPDSGGFDSVAMADRSFAAVGPANPSGSEVATG